MGGLRDVGGVHVVVVGHVPPVVLLQVQQVRHQRVGRDLKCLHQVALLIVNNNEINMIAMQSYRSILHSKELFKCIQLSGKTISIHLLEDCCFLFTSDSQTL